MVTAYVLINSNLDTEEDVATQLRDVELVKEIYQTKGAYDIVAKLESESNQNLRDVITWQIRRLDNVRSTMTLVETEHHQRMQN